MTRLTHLTLGALASTAALLILGWWWERKVRESAPLHPWQHRTLPPYEPQTKNWWEAL